MHLCLFLTLKSQSYSTALQGYHISTKIHEGVVEVSNTAQKFDIDKKKMFWWGHFRPNQKSYFGIVWSLNLDIRSVFWNRVILIKYSKKKIIFRENHDEVNLI